MKQVVPAALGSLVLLFGVASCGNPASPAGDPAGGTSSSAFGQPGGAGGPSTPGASGEVAAVSAKTMQVQSQASGQVAVTWTAKTTFTHQVSASLSDLAVGDCVVVASAAGTSDSPAGEVDADDVRISEAVDGSCAPMAAGGNAPGQPQGDPSGMPSGMPTDMPTDGMSGGPVRAGGAFGTVTAVTADGFTVESPSPAAPGESSDSDTRPTTQTTEVSVSVTDGTTFTTMAETTAKAVKVGVCVDARGDSDSTGAVTAKTVRVSPKVDGQCGVTFSVDNRQGS
jgi:hypothetical protein